MAKLRQIILIITLLSLSNFHWVLMQGYTWVEMAVNASAQSGESLLPALGNSIRGNTKCQRCCELEKTREENQHRSIQVESKLVAAIHQEVCCLNPLISFFPNPGNIQESDFSRSDVPETPPPRSV